MMSDELKATVCGITGMYTGFIPYARTEKRSDVSGKVRPVEDKRGWATQQTCCSVPGA